MGSDTKRLFFTADAKLSVKRGTRPVAGKFAANGAQEVESIATLSGYPIVWNVLSSDRGGYVVRLLPNSAKFETPTQAYWHHDPARVLGNTANGTLRLTPDDIGVKVEIDLPDTSDGRDAETLVGNRFVTGMSFSMVTAPEGGTTTENGQEILNVTSFQCDEISITGVPSFTQTSIEVKDDDDDPDYSALALESHRFDKLRFGFMALDE